MFKLKVFLSAICLLSLVTLLTGCYITGNGEKEVSTKVTSISEQSTSQTGETTVTTTSASTTVSTISTTKAKPITTTSKPEQYEYAYAGFDPAVTDMSVPFNKILLNRDYMLPEGYVPKLTEAVKGSGVMLDYRVAPYYQQMYDAALLEGITLNPISGYRSFERQKTNFENRIAMYENQGLNKTDATIKASKIVLLPGTSEHNAGLAMDICSLSVKFEDTKEFNWLQAHAHEYGFIMRYPKDKTEITKVTYEPWHYRYVGVEIANQLKSSGMALEEYLGKA